MTTVQAERPTNVTDRKQSTGYVCENYARAAVRRARFLSDRRIVGNAEDALRWLMARGIALIDQLHPEAARQVWDTLQNQAKLACSRAALADGVKYVLELTIVTPDSRPGTYREYLDVEVTHVFAIDPQPAIPPPEGAGRHRRP